MPKTKSKLKKADIENIKNYFLTNYKDAKTELNYQNAYELLVAVMLSAQCTDKRVNIVTKDLFIKYKNIDELANANLSELKQAISSISFYNNKAQNLIKMAQKLRGEYNSLVPLDREILKSLAGVGQKTANVVLIEYSNANFMAVDTHVFRVSHRLGLSNAKTPLATEIDLSKIFKTDLNILHQAFVLFGRYKCKAIKPICKDCELMVYCNLHT